MTSTVQDITSEEPVKPRLVDLVEQYMTELYESDGEVTLKLEELDEALDQKALNYQRIAILLQAKKVAQLAEAAALEASVLDLKKRAARIQAEIDGLSDRLLKAMVDTGKTKISTIIRNLSVMPTYSIDVPKDWAEKAPEAYVKVTREPRKSLLATEYRDRVKGLMAAGVKEIEARAAAANLLPDGVSVIAGSWLKGLTTTSGDRSTG